MDNKALSLNLVLKKRGSRDAFASSGVPVPTPSDFSEKVEKTVYGELSDATPPSKALEVFPEWSALLVKSIVLGFSVWVVRNHVDGIALARETGHPALILDDVLKMKGRTAEEARAALLPKLIAVEQ